MRTHPALAQDVEIAWIPPAAGAVSGFNVYIAPSTSGALIASPIDVGRPSVDGAGIARARISVNPAASLHIEMTSYDASRRESARSNRVVLVRGAEALEAPFWSTSFSSSRLGENAPGFVGASFAVSEFPAGNRALGIPYTVGYPVARFTAASSSDWKPYELSGRLYLQSGAPRAGVAVRVALAGRSGDPFGGGFRLGRNTAGVFAVQSNAALSLVCANSTSTGVVATTQRWFRFRVRYTEPEDRARVRAKVWADGTTEPSNWQVDCSAPGLPAVDSGVFALYRDGSGAVYWDDLVVQNVGGWWSDIPYL